jgi:phage tail sheath protein FI
MARSTYAAPGVYVEEIPSARQPIAGVGTNTVGFIGIIPEDVVYIPVANEEYDPVLAQHLLDFQQLTGPGAAAERQALRTDLERAEADAAARAAREAVARDLDRAVAQIPQAREDVNTATERRDAARRAVEQDEKAVADAAAADRPTAERALRRQQTLLTTAERDLTTATERLNDLTQEQERLARALAAADAQSGGAAAPPSGGAAAPPGGGAAAPPGGGAAAAKVEAEDLTYETTPPDSDLTSKSKFRPYYLEQFKILADEFDTKLCTNFTEYTNHFGSFSAFKATPENPEDNPLKWTFKPLHPGHHLLTHAVDGFFRNGGTRCFVARIKNLSNLQRALTEFESIDEIAILAAPGLPKSADTWGQLQDYCEDDNHQNVFAILDLPAVINNGTDNDFDVEQLQYDAPEPLLPHTSTHAACYAPFIEVVDPAKLLQDSDPARQVAPKYRGRTYAAPSGHVAGIYARTDEERGVHKAPANAQVRGAVEVKYYIGRPRQELLNPQGVNCIRLMNGDVTVWGARTVGGDRNGEWKYINVRRFAGFLEESIKRGTQWVVFEPNDPSLWSKIILNVSAFLTILWHNGALFGLTPQEAFYVKCDEELNPAEVRDLGMVVTEIGVAIVRPAEFVIFRITQSTGPRQG